MLYPKTCQIWHILPFWNSFVSVPKTWGEVQYFQNYLMRLSCTHRKHRQYQILYFPLYPPLDESEKLARRVVMSETVKWIHLFSDCIGLIFTNLISLACQLDSKHLYQSVKILAYVIITFLIITYSSVCIIMFNLLFAMLIRCTKYIAIAYEV